MMGMSIIELLSGPGFLNAKQETMEDFWTDGAARRKVTALMNVP